MANLSEHSWTYTLIDSKGDPLSIEQVVVLVDPELVGLKVDEVVPVGRMLSPGDVVWKGKFQEPEIRGPWLPTETM